MNVEKRFYSPTSDKQAWELVNKAYNNKSNPMTPTVLWTKMFGKYAIELSRGRQFSMNKEQIYGVTIVDNKGKRTDLSTAVFSEEEALDYIKEIVNETKDKIKDRQMEE